MPIRVFNTLTKRKEVFEPQEPGVVKMYCCGPTVYDYFHIGNARAFVVFDLVRRYLRYRGYRVTYVQNFTDVDDKIIRRAAEEHMAVQDLAEKYIRAYFEDAAALGIEPADVQPRVTMHMHEIIDMIQALLDKGFAYRIQEDVYFDTSRDPDYGKLSGQDPAALMAGARVEVDERKRHPLDFALWKGSKPGEVAWDSPWGKGRPGWHIECSAMSRTYLGDTLDIHAGGQDLIFPHHENEIAQSECVTGHPFARYWMHNGYLQWNRVKMSKSLGNVVTVRELLKRVRPHAIRLYLLSAHYRHPLNFSLELLEQADRGLERIESSLRDLGDWLGPDSSLTGAVTEESGHVPGLEVDEVQRIHEKWTEAMDDDFNTAEALGALYEGVGLANRAIREQDVTRAKAWQGWLSYHARFMGLIADGQKESETEREKIEALIARRAEARKKRDWAAADRIRDQLSEMGIVLEDTPYGVRWRRRGS
ncbi:cysteine--tRNA ligase [Kyrpidia tusciae]|uniref:Cysteine--tRNA ligase n=1 Tax=Kyrpidia tusciae (strain DSM 2912 / NBRC 15312 / T2) TaxID=562970 RepID=D5WRP8_KYRT2|nr:cysteine--tRNA ligase [Kyrpidia tusciae]ADG04909.1 cysteinyl-tRNA synthetase [Kyrpidia tusciae DSM 2912]